MKKPTYDEVRALLDELNVAVVVTPGEDKRLPRVGFVNNPWQRYAGIEVFDQVTKRWQKH